MPHQHSDYVNEQRMSLSLPPQSLQIPVQCCFLGELSGDCALSGLGSVPPGAPPPSPRIHLQVPRAGCTRGAISSLLGRGGRISQRLSVPLGSDPVASSAACQLLKPMSGKHTSSL